MLRRLCPVTVAVLALAFVAGPVRATCLHGTADGAAPEAMGHAGHEMPMGEVSPVAAREHPPPLRRHVDLQRCLI